MTTSFGATARRSLAIAPLSPPAASRASAMRPGVAPSAPAGSLGGPLGPSATHASSICSLLWNQGGQTDHFLFDIWHPAGITDLFYNLRSFVRELGFCPDPFGG